MVELAKTLEEFRTALSTTRIPEDQATLILGAAAGVIIALTKR